MKIVYIVPLLAVLAGADTLSAQTPSVRALTLALQFNKLKSAHKEKHGVTHQKYREVVSEAWIAQPSDYAGTYISRTPALNIAIDAEGRVTGSGRDHGHFFLRDAKIQEGLLTATKVYTYGATENFEAVLLKLSDRASPDSAFQVRHAIAFLMVDADYGVGTPLRVIVEKQ